MREVLQTLERSRGHKEPADLTATQVEHVMPQTLSGEWRQTLGPDAERIHTECLHRPGNLTLSAYNQELWNHPFGTKDLIRNNLITWFPGTVSNLVDVRRSVQYLHQDFSPADFCMSPPAQS